MTHWHSAFFLPWKIYHMQLEHLRAGRVHAPDLCSSKGNGHVLKLQSCNSIFSSAGRVWSNQSLQTKLSAAVYIWEERELFLWEWCSSGKMPRLAHPCVKHIAGITWHCCLQVKLLLMSAVLALLEEAWQDDGKKIIHPSSLNESSSLFLTLWTPTAAPVKLDGSTYLG